MLLPVAIEQVVGLAGKLPGYFDELRNRALSLIERLERENVVEGGSVQGFASRFGQQALGYVGTALSNLLQSSLIVINLISLVFITPIVTFYLLRDWDRLVAAIRNVVPPRHRPIARRLAREIDQVLAGFLRGQGMVCAFLALFYGIGLVLVGLDYGAIIGVLTGLFSFIPYVGMFMGVAVGLTVAIFQFGAFCPGSPGRRRVRRRPVHRGQLPHPARRRLPHPPAPGLGDLRRPGRHGTLRPDRHLPRHARRRGDRRPGPLWRRALASQRLLSRGAGPAGHPLSASTVRRIQSLNSLR